MVLEAILYATLQRLIRWKSVTLFGSFTLGIRTMWVSLNFFLGGGGDTKV